jgi:hypothetical protein
MFKALTAAMKRLAPAVALATLLLLTGCVLQSETPLVSDSDGTLALQDLGARFASYSQHGTSWEKDDDVLSFKAEGHHYLGSDGQSTITVTFMAVKPGLWAVQGEEPGKPASYMIAERRDDALYLAPIACEPLAKAGTFAALVEFKGDDCYAKPGADAASLFAAAAALDLPETLKLVPETGG